MDPDHPVAHDLGIRRGRIVGLDEAVTSIGDIEVAATCVEDSESERAAP
ncbi:hypothetical protein NKH18_38815 [Streptomyces sp. M10(2022)]